MAMCHIELKSVEGCGGFLEEQEHEGHAWETVSTYILSECKDQGSQLTEICWPCYFTAVLRLAAMEESHSKLLCVFYRNRV